MFDLSRYIGSQYEKVKVSANITVKEESLIGILEQLKQDKLLSDFLSEILNDLIKGNLVRLTDLVSSGFAVIPITPQAQQSAIGSYIKELYNQDNSASNFIYTVNNLIQTLNNISINYPTAQSFIQQVPAVQGAVPIAQGVVPAVQGAVPIAQGVHTQTIPYTIQQPIQQPQWVSQGVVQEVQQGATQKTIISEQSNYNKKDDFSENVKIIDQELD
ncbi:MAG: hypothetical protein N2444_09865, partial [Methylocystis sp.]|nr:hypothetical protein [Methylocystis sp.]